MLFALTFMLLLYQAKLGSKENTEGRESREGREGRGVGESGVEKRKLMKTNTLMKMFADSKLYLFLKLT